MTSSRRASRSDPRPGLAPDAGSPPGAPGEPPPALALGLATDADVERVRRPPRAGRGAAGRAASAVTRTLYYDTQEFALRRAGVSLGVRQVGRQHVQVVEATPSGAGALPFADRACSTAALSGSDPEPGRIDDPGLRVRVIAETLEPGQPLVPMVEVDARATRRRLAVGDGEVELLLETGEIRTRAGSLPLRELRISLLRGAPRLLYDAALALHEGVELRPLWSGPAERGLASLTGERPQPRRAQRPKLAADATLEAAMAAILASAFEQVLANREPAREGHDREGVHQMRVGLRRLRAALSLFRPFLPKEPATGLRAELRWLGRELGRVRDADVFAEETLEPLFRRHADDRALKRLREEARALREERQAALRAVLDSRRATALVLGFARWLVGQQWREQALSEEGAQLFAPARGFADEVLGRRHERALELGDDVAARTEAERHALRIRLKKLRYAAEFWSDLYPPRRVERYARRLARLQDDLGNLNDAACAEELLGEVLARLGTERGVEHERAAGFVCGWLGARADRRLARLAKRWGRFARTAPFWA
jgi:CHAD domain-containing protein